MFYTRKPNPLAQIFDRPENTGLSRPFLPPTHDLSEQQTAMFHLNRQKQMGHINLEELSLRKINDEKSEFSKFENKKLDYLDGNTNHPGDMYERSLHRRYGAKTLIVDRQRKLKVMLDKAKEFYY